MYNLAAYRTSNSIPPQCICSDGASAVLKGWGSEEFVYHRPEESSQQAIIVDTVKLLHFKSGKRLSLHQHIEKSEFFFVLSGEFLIEMLDLSTQTLHSFILKDGERIFVPKGLFHRMTCDKEGTILEVSTLDRVSDSYRLIKGD